MAVPGPLLPLYIGTAGRRSQRRLSSAVLVAWLIASITRRSSNVSSSLMSSRLSCNRSIRSIRYAQTHPATPALTPRKHAHTQHARPPEPRLTRAPSPLACHVSHQNDIITGVFSSTMMADWDNDDVNLLKWRAETAETGFEKTPAGDVHIPEQVQPPPLSMPFHALPCPSMTFHDLP